MKGELRDGEHASGIRPAIVCEVKNHKLIKDRQPHRKRKKQKSNGQGKPGARQRVEVVSAFVLRRCRWELLAQHTRQDAAWKRWEAAWSGRSDGASGRLEGELARALWEPVCPVRESWYRAAPGQRHLFEGQTPTTQCPQSLGQVHRCARSSADNSPRRKAPRARLIIHQIHTTGGDRL